MNDPSSEPSQPSAPVGPALAQQADATVHDPYIALRFADYRRYFTGNACALIGTQMASITVGWEVYARTNSTFALGLIGLMQVIPIILLVLPAGHFVDRLDRKKLVLAATAGQLLIFILLALSSRFSNRLAAYAGWRHVPFGDLHIPLLFLLLTFNGACRAVNQPAKQSLLPLLVPAKHFANAVTWNASMFEMTNVVGPMLAGVIIYLMQGENPHDTWAYTMVYATNAFLQTVQWINISRIHLHHTPKPREPMTMQSMLAGVHFVFSNKIILGVITLDLMAVLLGGATALLPAFAKDILHIGPLGLACLRAAPSVGAIATAIFLAHQPPMQRAGRNLLFAVAGFGAATIVFGLSHNFWLSLAALALTGMFDNISVVVRHSLVQLRTPDEMRGRVNAVNSLFISSSNELGEFESGFTAHLAIRYFGQAAGLMTAVVAGGIGTILVAATIALGWPEVRSVKKLDKH